MTKSFAERFVRLVDDRFSLIEKPGGDCIFWDKQAGCTVYPARPDQCRAWPFWPENLESPESGQVSARSAPGRVTDGSIRSTRSRYPSRWSKNDPCVRPCFRRGRHRRPAAIPRRAAGSFTPSSMPRWRGWPRSADQRPLLPLPRVRTYPVPLAARVRLSPERVPPGRPGRSTPARRVPGRMIAAVARPAKPGRWVAASTSVTRPTRKRPRAVGAIPSPAQAAGPTPWPTVELCPPPSTPP